VNNAEAQADAAIRTELARHGDEFAGYIFGLDNFFRPQGVADGFKKDDAEGGFPGHEHCLVLSTYYEFVRKSAVEELPQGLGGQIDMLFRIEEAETEAHGPLGKGSDGSVGRRSAMKTGAAHDVPLFVKIKGCIGRRYIPEIE